MIIDFIIEDLMLNSYLQKNFHTLFLWMLSASLKLEKDVFSYPIVWILEIRSGRIMWKSGKRFHC